MLAERYDDGILYSVYRKVRPVVFFLSPMKLSSTFSEAIGKYILGFASRGSEVRIPRGRKYPASI